MLAVTCRGNMTLLLVAWPNPQDAVIEQRRAAREAAEEVAARNWQIRTVGQSGGTAPVAGCCA